MIIWMFVLIAVYAMLDWGLRRKLGIKGKVFGRYQHISPRFKQLETALLITFFVVLVVGLFVFPNVEPFFYTGTFLIALLFIRGLEQWRFAREKREYISQWLGITMVLLLMILIIFR